jgi:hypothetical protein
LIVPDARAVLLDLHRTRRRTRIKEIDAFEALYRVYLTAVLGGVAVWILSGLTGDHRVIASTVARVRQDGPQVVGAVIALVWAVGFRSGGRGGPLVLEAAEVRHVMLAPVERSIVLRPSALRQLRFGIFAGAVAGAVAGLLAFRRLPGPPLEWIATGAATGVLAAAGSLGLGMILSGRHPGSETAGRWTGGLLALGVLGWSAADVATATSTSPMSFLGRLALSPLGWHPTALIGVVVAGAAVAVGLASVGGCSIEAAERRATLVGQIRFAATLRDIRTVVVLRRQLGQELPRQRKRPNRPGRSGFRVSRWPVWARGWQGLVRFPPMRALRLAALAVAAGAAEAGAWRGTTPLIMVAGLALYVAGLDAIEPLSQEIDHPDRRDAYPLPSGEIYLRLLGPSLVLMMGVGVVASGVAVLLAHGRGLSVAVGAVLIVPAGGAGLAAAVTSIIQGPPPVSSASNLFLPPEVAGIRAMVRTFWPPILATLGTVAVLSGRHHTAPPGPVGPVATTAIPVVILLLAVATWVRRHDDLHAWFRSLSADFEAASRPKGAGPAAR